MHGNLKFCKYSRLTKKMITCITGIYDTWFEAVFFLEILANFVYMRSFSSFGAEIKKFLASHERDLFPVGPCCAVPSRAGPGREHFSSTLYTHMKLPSLRSVVTNITYILLRVQSVFSSIFHRKLQSNNLNK